MTFRSSWVPLILTGGIAAPARDVFTLSLPGLGLEVEAILFRGHAPRVIPW
jgi:hypothetical protein